MADDDPPKIPQYQSVTPQGIEYPAQPDIWDYYRTNEFAYNMGRFKYQPTVDMQLGAIPGITSSFLGAQQQGWNQQLAQQTQGSQAAFDELMRQYGIAAPQIAGTQFGLTQQFAPYYTNYLQQAGAQTGAQLQGMSQAYNPQFFDVYGQMGQNISQGLEAGYDLGADLEREVAQSYRGAQVARGNYLGPAATAEEAYGLGQAATDLYNTRIGQGQAFLEGQQPTDLWAGMMGIYGPAGTALGMAQATAATGQPAVGLQSPVAVPNAQDAATLAMGTYQAPSIDWANQGLQAYGTYQGALTGWGATSVAGQTDYNSALINAANANNASMFLQYDKSFDQFLYEQAAAHGLYDTPSTSSAMGTAGAAIGAAGSVVAAGATAYAASAAGAAAAICWLARAVIPGHWKEWRKFLFTKAPASLRRAYIYGARRLANGLTEAGKVEIAEVMRKCLR